MSSHEPSLTVPSPAVPRAPVRPASHADLAAYATGDQMECLECGRPWLVLGIHVARSHGMTPDEYRRRHGLPDGYRLVADDTHARLSASALNRQPAPPPAQVTTACGECGAAIVRHQPNATEHARCEECKKLRHDAWVAANRVRQKTYKARYRAKPEAQEKERALARRRQQELTAARGYEQFTPIPTTCTGCGTSITRTLANLHRPVRLCPECRIARQRQQVRECDARRKLRASADAPPARMSCVKREAYAPE